MSSIDRRLPPCPAQLAPEPTGGSDAFSFPLLETEDDVGEPPPAAPEAEDSPPPLLPPGLLTYSPRSPGYAYRSATMTNRQSKLLRSPNRYCVSCAVQSGSVRCWSYSCCENS
jgi:hypothetical protein